MIHGILIMLTVILVIVLVLLIGSLYFDENDWKKKH